MGAYGCIAGNLLVTVDAGGPAHPCSHLPHTLGRVEELPRTWETNRWRLAFLERCRSREGRCASCGSLEICGGGCDAVSHYYGAGVTEPDPGLACGSGR